MDFFFFSYSSEEKRTSNTMGGARFYASPSTVHLGLLGRHLIFYNEEYYKPCKKSGDCNCSNKTQIKNRSGWRSNLARKRMGIWMKSTHSTPHEETCFPLLSFLQGFQAKCLLLLIQEIRIIPSLRL